MILWCAEFRWERYQSACYKSDFTLYEYRINEHSSITEIFSFPLVEKADKSETSMTIYSRQGGLKAMS
jgi:hypothetical protein